MFKRHDKLFDRDSLFEYTVFQRKDFKKVAK